MSRKSRKAQRRRKWRRRSRAVVSPTDAMHQVLGEFLTEMGRVEFRMLLLMDLINEAPLEALFDQYSGQVFGEKIRLFKEWCASGAMPEQHKPRLQRIYKNLDDLRSVRNFLIYGETWDGAFHGKPRQSYRVGLVKKNLEYLDEFERAEHGPNVFNVEQVRAASRRCAQICGELKDLRDTIAADAVPSDENAREGHDETRMRAE